MKITAILVMLVAASASRADVLGLNDYDALFADNADAIQELPNGAEAIETVGGVFVSRQDDTITTLDQSSGGAVGCFVNLLAHVESYASACDVTLSDGQATRLEDFRTKALTFYAQNASPAASLADTRESYDAYRATLPYGSADICDPQSNIAVFVGNFLAPSTDQVVADLIAVPRLPANNPCL